MAHFLGILWGSILAVYWLITGALLADLYDRYCDDLQASNNQCNDIDKKFILMPTTAFFCMTSWVSSHMINVCMSYVCPLLYRFFRQPSLSHDGCMANDRNTHPSP